MSTTLTIERLGAQGDGIAAGAAGAVYVPFTLPGETVTVARAAIGARAELLDVITPSSQRVTPPCRHFGSCGGCALQQFEPSAYLAWKRDKVGEALRREGIEAPLAPIVACAPGSRRRIVLSARRAGGRVLLGYNRALSHDIVDIVECPIAEPALVAALPSLRQLAGLLAPRTDAFRLTVTATAEGADVAASGAGSFNDKRRTAAAAFTLAAGFARLSIDGEVVLEPRRPTVDFGGAAVTPPPGGFLQAVAAAEAAMAERVVGHLAGARRIADLFSGSGAFALRLARQGEVHAVETDAAALAALARGARASQGMRRVTTELRDLGRRPLGAKELGGFDAVVFDPPRAGAAEQSRQLAGSHVPRVAAVSCNPVTLARDLRILIDGGYRLSAVVPVDQFLWSPHVEAVALLDKETVKPAFRRSAGWHRR